MSESVPTTHLISFASALPDANPTWNRQPLYVAVTPQQREFLRARFSAGKDRRPLDAALGAVFPAEVWIESLTRGITVARAAFPLTSRSARRRPRDETTLKNTRVKTLGELIARVPESLRSPEVEADLEAYVRQYVHGGHPEEKVILFGARAGISAPGSLAATINGVSRQWGCSAGFLIRSLLSTDLRGSCDEGAFMLPGEPFTTHLAGRVEVLESVLRGVRSLVADETTQAGAAAAEEEVFIELSTAA